MRSAVGRIPGLVLVGLLVVSVVGLAVSQTFINKAFDNQEVADVW